MNIIGFWASGVLNYLAYIKLSCRSLQGTNTLDFYELSKITVVKSFLTLFPACITATTAHAALHPIGQAMDKFQLTGQNLGPVFNSRSSCMLLRCYEAKRPNLKLKTRPKQFYLALNLTKPELHLGG